MKVEAPTLAQLAAAAYRNVTERNAIIAPADWEQSSDGVPVESVATSWCRDGKGAISVRTSLVFFGA